MKRGLSLALSLMICGAAEAADPPAQPKPATVVAARPAKPAKPLTLRIGDVRQYMMPSEYRAALQLPEADANTVVVEGQRELVPMKLVENVPLSLGSLWYAAKDPKNAWRLLVPVMNAPEFKPGPVPPPVFRWGP